MVAIEVSSYVTSNDTEQSVHNSCAWVGEVLTMNLNNDGFYCFNIAPIHSKDV